MTDVPDNVDRVARVAEALDPEAFGPCPDHWRELLPDSLTESDLAAFWAKRTAGVRKLAMEQASAAIEAMAMDVGVIENCTIDLRGAGYLAVGRNENNMFIATYNEGDKIFYEDGRLTLDGLHILGPVALEEMLAKARSEARMAAMGLADKTEAET